MNLDLTLLFSLNSLAGKSNWLDSLIIFLAEYLPYLVFLSIIFFLWSYRLSRKLQKQILLTLAFGLILSLGVTSFCRFLWPRPRPFLSFPINNLLTENSSSFPSRHATIFFALATIVFSFQKKWGLGLFLAAFLISLARVAAGIHYPSDILGGLIIGFLIGYLSFYSLRYLFELSTSSTNS